MTQSNCACDLVEARPGVWLCKIHNDIPRRVKLPPRFIQDCLDCDCDIGEYNGKHLTATAEQLNELRDRAEYYSDASGPDLAPRGLKAAAKALLRALDRECAQKRHAVAAGERKAV